MNGGSHLEGGGSALYTLHDGCQHGRMVGERMGQGSVTPGVVSSPCVWLSSLVQQVWDSLTFKYFISFWIFQVLNLKLSFINFSVKQFK